MTFRMASMTLLWWPHKLWW